MTSVGETVERVTIGACGGRTDRREDKKIRRLDYLIILLAGTVAHERAAFLHGLPTPPRAVDDLAAVTAELQGIGDDRPEVWAELFRITTGVVVRHWRAINRVALLLERHGEISGDQLGVIQATEIIRPTEATA